MRERAAERSLHAGGCDIVFFLGWRSTANQRTRPSQTQEPRPYPLLSPTSPPSQHSVQHPANNADRTAFNHSYSRTTEHPCMASSSYALPPLEHTPGAPSFLLQVTHLGPSSSLLWVGTSNSTGKPSAGVRLGGDWVCGMPGPSVRSLPCLPPPPFSSLFPLNSKETGTGRTRQLISLFVFIRVDSRWAKRASRQWGRRCSERHLRPTSPCPSPSV